VTIVADGYRSRAVASSLAGVAVLALVAALALVGLNAGRVGGGSVGAYVFLAVAVLAYAGTGRLIASRLPGNATRITGRIPAASSPGPVPAPVLIQ